MRCIPPLLASLALLVSACGGAPQPSERGARIGMSGDDTSGAGAAASASQPSGGSRNGTASGPTGMEVPGTS